MSWTTSIDDLRELLADDATNKLRYRKKVFGQVDGSNTVFKTLEKRRVTDLTTATGSLGVFVNDAAVVVSADDTAVGEFTLSVAPNNGDLIQASYYYQWFLDNELQSFLQSATNWLGYTDVTTIPNGLRPAAKYYAAQEAYHHLALDNAERLTETYRLEDQPADGVESVMTLYKDLAKDAKEKAETLRDNYYEGQGQQKGPISVSLAGAVRKVVPKG